MAKRLFAPILSKILKEDLDDECPPERVDPILFMQPFRATATPEGIVTEEGRIKGELAIPPRRWRQ